MNRPHNCRKLVSIENHLKVPIPPLKFICGSYQVIVLRQNALTNYLRGILVIVLGAVFLVRNNQK